MATVGICLCVVFGGVVVVCSYLGVIEIETSLLNTVLNVGDRVVVTISVGMVINTPPCDTVVACSGCIAVIVLVG